jgi:hypothetical protein
MAFTLAERGLRGVAVGTSLGFLQELLVADLWSLRPSQRSRSRGWRLSSAPHGQTPP